MLCSPYPSPKALGDMGTEAGRKGAEAREKVLEGVGSGGRESGGIGGSGDDVVGGVDRARGG